MVCKGDPRFGRAHVDRHAHGLVRHKGVGRKLPLGKGLDDRLNKAAVRSMRRCTEIYDAGFNLAEESGTKRRRSEKENVGVVVPAKKQRVSADRALALGC